MRLYRHHRSAIVWWFAAISLAVLTGSVVSRLVASAEAQAARYGSLEKVPVATRAIETGEVLTTGDVETQEVPGAFVPEGDLAELPTGTAALVPIAQGEPLLASKLANGAQSGISALVPKGARALAVPKGPGSPPLIRGDRVDVLATFDRDTESNPDPAQPQSQALPQPTSDPTFPVAQGARVLDVGEEAVTLAVSVDDAPRVAFTIARGTATLALAPPG